MTFKEGNVLLPCYCRYRSFSSSDFYNTHSECGPFSPEIKNMHRGIILDKEGQKEQCLDRNQAVSERKETRPVLVTESSQSIQ